MRRSAAQRSVSAQATRRAARGDRHPGDASEFLLRALPAPLHAGLGAVVVLASALAHGFNGRRLETLIDVLAVPARTLLRWRQWWLTQFVITPFWISVRGRFMPPLAVDGLPGTLLARFDRGADRGDDGPRLTRMLRFVAPLSTKTEGR